MTTPCPNCQANIEIDVESRAALRDHTHFACPACQGLVPVPALAKPQMQLNPAPGARTTAPALPAHPRQKAATASRKASRNLLILGATALLVLGGLAFVLASRKSSDTHLTTQNIRNEIINNTYFQNLIATGVTTRPELERLAAIVPYSGGFIGISSETSDWEQSKASAARLGAMILDIEPATGYTKETLVSWLNTRMAEHLQAPAWVRQRGAPATLDGKEVFESAAVARKRPYFVHWNAASNRQGLATSGAGGLGDVPATDWDSFEPGALVFDDKLTTDDKFEKFYYFAGQYGNRFTVLPGVGIKSQKGHTMSMLWARAVLGKRCRAEFDVEIPEDSHLRWVLKGSGTGNGSNTGDAFFIHNGVLTVHKSGVEWKRKPLPKATGIARSARIQTDYNGSHFRVFFDGKLVLDESAEAELDGPLHCWFGLSGVHCIYKNLRIYSSNANQNLEPLWSPDAGNSPKPKPNGKQIYVSSFSRAKSKPIGWWDVTSKTLFEESGTMMLKGGSIAVLEKPISRNSAIEIVFEYPSHESLNFRIPLVYASEMPREMSRLIGAWALSVPHGHGTSVLKWTNETPRVVPGETIWHAVAFGDTDVVQSQQFYAPTSERQYLLRIEITDLDILMFLNGGLFMDARNPSFKNFEGNSLYLGLAQFYGSSLVHSVNIYEIETN